MTKARSNAVANAAKGDLTVGNGTDLSGILAVGSNGDTLVADSSTATGLSYQANFAAGKNKIINGDFYVNQRNFTTIPSGGGFVFDRFQCAPSGATAAASAQTFALGTAPVAGYEGKNFLRWDVTTGNDFCRVVHTIESVRTFAGQTATLSFWAKGTNPTTAGNLKTSIVQNFGTGGSPSSQIRSAEQTFVLTANWTRYSFTFSLPSIASKTIGTDNNDRLEIEIGQQSSASTDAWTLDLWGVQLEAGSTATAFQTATGTIQGELAACQRYYYRLGGGNLYDTISVNGFQATAALYYSISQHPVPLRRSPNIEFSNLQTAASAPVSAGGLQDTGINIALVAWTTSGATPANGIYLRAGNSLSGYLAFNAEL
jgi:hypothetical protein